VIEASLETGLWDRSPMPEPKHFWMIEVGAGAKFGQAELG